MALDLDTFLTALYTIVDDLYRERLAGTLARRPGPSPALSDSEVLTLAICAEWGAWDSERGFWRFACQRLRHLFPRLVTSRSSTAGGAPSSRPWPRSSARSLSGSGRTWDGSGCWTPSRSR